MKKIMRIIISISLTVLDIFYCPLNVKALDNEDKEVTIIYSMKWVDENGNPIPALQSTFEGDCGYAKLNASGSLVNVVIHPYGNWIGWDFTGDVNDSRGDNHHFYRYSVGQYSLSESYELTHRGSRTLTLTGMARDITGKGCEVIPGASIGHKW